MESGVSHHARGRVMLRDLEKLGVACGVLAANRSWTTFAQLANRIVDGGAFARVLDVAIVQVWSDEDHGTTVAFFDVDGWRAELAIELGRDGAVSTADRQLLAELVRREFIVKDRADALARQIASKAPVRDTWLERGGVEQMFDVPDATRLPVPCSPELLRQLVPHVQLTPRRLARGTAERPKAPRRRTVSAAAVVLEDMSLSSDAKAPTTAAVPPATKEAPESAVRPTKPPLPLDSAIRSTKRPPDR